jgi:hypothetical protein
MEPSTLDINTLNKTLPPTPAWDEDITTKQKTPQQGSPNALRELDILLRDSTTPDGQEVIPHW